MSYGFALLQSSEVPDGWTCAICQESDQEDQIIAHIRYVERDEEATIIFSNGGEKHPIHHKCFKEAFVTGLPMCPSCREQLFTVTVLSERVVTRTDETQDPEIAITMSFFKFTAPLTGLLPFKEHLWGRYPCPSLTGSPPPFKEHLWGRYPCPSLSVAEKTE